MAGVEFDTSATNGFHLKKSKSSLCLPSSRLATSVSKVKTLICNRDSVMMTNYAHICNVAGFVPPALKMNNVCKLSSIMWQEVDLI